MKIDKLKFNDLRKKKVHIGIRVSEHERKQLEIFCQREQISITNFLRYAIRVAINEREEN